MKISALLLSFSLFINCCIISSFSQTVKILKGVTLIDGTGTGPRQNVNVVIKGDVIDTVLSSNASLPKGATVTDYSGKFVMPALINGHCHLGLLKGDNSSPKNYTRENVLRHLEKYEQYGISTVLSLGTDREIIFSLRDSSRKGLLPGATIYTAGYGLTAMGSSPPANLSTDLRRPQTVEGAVKDVDQLALLKPDFVKIWVDDFFGIAAKMQPEIYEAVIKEAHKKGLRVAAHVYYLEDAKRLVNAGVDALAHSIRDKEVDNELINAMKQKGVYYIPTLTLDEYNIIYAGDAPWINDSFFKASLEPGVWERLTSSAFRQQLKNDTTLSIKKAAFEMAMRNLKKLADAGVVIVLGSDSGAQPVRTQGFSEHLELTLMVEAGLTPMQAIVAATNNGAKLLQINKQYGMLKTNMKADFIVLRGNPLSDIKQTRNIVAVWKNGVQVGSGIRN
jgi:imidazolonepropionase-like amidohydrolase